MKKAHYSAYLYIAPIFLFFIIFLLYPLFDTFRVSFYDWNGIDDHMLYIGLNNYKDIFNDPLFYKSFTNFIIFSVLVISIQMSLGFIIAYLMRKNLPLYGIYRTIIFAPIIITPIVVSYIFVKILAYNDGLINVFFRAIGLDSLALSWMTDPGIALFSIIGVTIWSGTGFSMAVYTSAMTSLSGEVLEASLIDGANRWQRVVKVIWPMLKNTHYSLTIIGFISAFKIFDIVYLMTRGGPAHATEMPSTYMFHKAFVTYEQGYASGIASVIIVIAILITLIQMRLSRDTN